MSKCWKIGITGGIGSGKTTVCRIFETLGIPVYYADDWAKWLVVNDPALKASMIDAFGPETFFPDGSYNRAYVAGLVFSKPKMLEILNQLVHPVVAAHGMEWHRKVVDTGVPYTIKEAALLLESGSYRQLDRLIVVIAPEDVRIQRVVARDGASEEAVRKRMEQQWPEREKIARADFLINNDGCHLLIPQVLAIHREILSLK